MSRTKLKRYGIIALVFVALMAGYTWGQIDCRKVTARKYRYVLKFNEAHGHYYVDVIPVEREYLDSINASKPKVKAND